MKGFKLLLFQLLTGFSIGQYVIFNDELFKILDFHMYTPFSQSSIIKTSWKRPIFFTIIMANEYGGVEIVGSKAVKTLYESDRIYGFNLKLF